MTWARGTLKTIKRYILKLLNNNYTQTETFEKNKDSLRFVVFSIKK